MVYSLDATRCIILHLAATQSLEHASNKTDCLVCGLIVGVVAIVLGQVCANITPLSHAKSDCLLWFDNTVWQLYRDSRGWLMKPPVASCLSTSVHACARAPWRLRLKMRQLLLPPFAIALLCSHAVLNVADATQVRTLSELGWFLTTGTLAQLFALVVVVVKLFMSPLQGTARCLTPHRVSCAVLSVQGPSSHSPQSLLRCLVSLICSCQMLCSCVCGCHRPLLNISPVFVWDAALPVKCVLAADTRSLCLKHAEVHKQQLTQYVCVQALQQSWCTLGRCRHLLSLS